ncbi:MAG: hypothetical protein WCK37_01750 [Candidatus Falkowbacteria bacterium]
MEIRSYYENKGNIKQDYSRKSLQNPFYGKRGNSNKNIFGNFKIILIAAVFFIILLFWFFLFSPVFNIRSVKIDGLIRTNESDVSSIIQNQIASQRALIFSQKNIIIFNKGKAINDLLDKFGFLDVSIKKSITGNLNISVHEREYAFIWGENGDYYYIDKDGHVINKIPSNFTPIANLNIIPSVSTSTDLNASSTDIASAPVPDVLSIQKEALIEVKKNNKDNYSIIDNLYNPLIKNDIITIDPIYLDFVNKISKIMDAEADHSLWVSRFIIDSDIDTIKAQLNSGLTIYFSVKQVPEDQIKSLTALKDKLNKTIKKKVDLRYGDRIYYE